MFSKRKSVSTTHVAVVTDQNLDFVCTWLHRGRKKKYVVLVRSKCWDGFPQWKSMWSLTPNIEEGEEVGEGMLFSPSIWFKLPSSSLVDVHFLVLQLREFSSIQGRWHYCPHFYGPIVIVAICLNLLNWPSEHPKWFGTFVTIPVWDPESFNTLPRVL